MAQIFVDLSTRANLSGFREMDAAEQQQLIKLKQLEVALKQAEAATAQYGSAAASSHERAARAAATADATQRKLNDTMARRMGLRHGADAVLTPQTRQIVRQITEQGGADGDYAHNVMRRAAEATANRNVIAERLRRRRATQQEAERVRREVERWQQHDAPGAMGDVLIDHARSSDRTGDVGERARRLTARRIRSSPELSGRVNEQEFDRMVDQNVERMQTRMRRMNDRMTTAMRRMTDYGGDHDTGTYGSLGPGTAPDGSPRTPVDRRQLAHEQRRANYARISGTIDRTALPLGLGAAAGVGIVAQVGQQEATLGQALVGTEKTLAPVYGVGENAARRGAIRRDVFSKSTANGLSVDSVAETIGRLQAIAADLPKETQGEILRQSLGSSSIGVKDISGFALGLNALQRTFAPDSKDPARTRQLSNKWFNAADRGGVDVDSFTPYLSSIAQASKVAGYGEDDMFSLTEVTSKAAMRDENLAMSIRNMPLKMVDATRLGKTRRTGSMFGDLEQVQKMSAEEQLDIFSLETITGAKFVMENMNGLKAARAASATTTGDVSVIDQKRAAALSDPVAMSSRLIGAANQVSANAPAAAAEDPVLRERMQAKAIADAGVDSALPDQSEWTKTGFKVLTDTVRLGRSAMKSMGLPDLTAGTLAGGMADFAENQGVRRTLDALEREKRTSEAGALKLRYGKMFGLRNPLTGNATGSAEADDYEGAIARFKLPELSVNTFLEQMKTGDIGSEAASRVPPRAATTSGDRNAASLLTSAV